MVTFTGISRQILSGGYLGGQGDLVSIPKRPINRMMTPVMDVNLINLVTKSP